jgi:hypothetical protein
VSGLRELASRFPRFAGRCHLVTPESTLLRPEQSRTGVGTMSLDHFLVAVGRQAEAAVAERLGAG